MNTLLFRYLVQRFFTMFFLVMPAIIGIYIVIDAFEKMGDFLDANVPFFRALLYFFYSSPAVIVELTPLGILISGLLASLILARNMELLAIKSIGASPGKIMFPFIAAAFSAALAVTLLNIMVFPDMIRRAENMFLTEVKKKPPKGMMVGNRLYYRGHGTIFSAVADVADMSVLSSFDWIKFADDYTMLEVVSAERSVYVKGKGWILEDGMACSFENGIVSKSFIKRAFDFPETPEDFAALRTPTSEAGILELWGMIKRLKAANLPCYRQETMMWSKLLYDFIGVSLLILCMPVILFRISGSPVAGLVAGALAGFAIWFIWSLGVTFGATGRIPPALAPVGLNLLLLFAGYLLYRKI